MEIGKFKLAKADLVRPPNKPAQEQIIPKQKPYTEKVFKLEVDDFIKGFIGGFPKDEMLLKIQSVLDKAVDAGAIEPQEGIKYLRERKQQLVDFARENYGQELPGIEDRENFYAGSSLEQFGSKIKDLHLKGTSSPKINELLGFEKDRSTTIDDFIKSMKKGEAPIKITADELSKRPNIKGTNISGKPGERVKDLKKYISDFEKKEGRLPSKAELRAANFDLTTTINPAIERGDVEVLPEDVSRSKGGFKRTSEELTLLADNQKVLDIFRKGNPTLKDLKTIKNVIGPVSDKVAASRILQLANIFANTGVEEARGLNIKPKFKKNALKIIEASDFQPYIRDAYEELIGKSVGEKSIKRIKQEIRGSDLYKQSDLSKFYNIDELLGVTSSVTKGTTPYGIFGQVIEGGINRQEKFQWDAEKSKLELKLQNTIKKFGRNSKEANVVKKEFNTKAKEAEEAINYGKAIGAKKVTLPRVSFRSPNFTISNFKDFNKTYKKAFMDNFEEKGYSFEIPKNIRTIPQLRDDIKDPKSSTYKSLINSLKKGFNEYDEKKLFQKLKDATPESIKKNLKFIPRIASLEDDISDKRYASASNIMSDATYVDDKEEQTFAKENPITTGVGLTVPSAVAVQKAAGVPILKALGNIGKYPFKAAGSLPGAGYFAYDTIQRNLEEGESLPRSILDKEVGIELLLPEAFKKAGPLMLKAARLSTPLGAGITAAGVAKDYYDFVQREIERKAADPEAYRVEQEEQMGIAAANGGLIRKGFKDGPEDPSKRKFMKIAGGLASLPIIGRFFDVAQVAEKAAPAAVEAIKNAPPHFVGLVNKIRALGKVFPGSKERSEVYRYDDYEMDIDYDTGTIDITKNKEGMFGDEIAPMEQVKMTYSPGVVDETTGGKVADQYDEYTVRPDDDGKMKDVEDGVPDDVIDEGSISKEELEQLIIENIKKGEK